MSNKAKPLGDENYIPTAGEELLWKGVIYVAALADAEAYAPYFWGDNIPASQYYQFGTCRGCGTELVSYAKIAVCPVCGNDDVRLT